MINYLQYSLNKLRNCLILFLNTHLLRIHPHTWLVSDKYFQNPCFCRSWKLIRLTDTLSVPIRYASGSFAVSLISNPLETAHKNKTFPRSLSWDHSLITPSIRVVDSHWGTLKVMHLPCLCPDLLTFTILE